MNDFDELTPKVFDALARHSDTALTIPEIARLTWQTEHPHRVRTRLAALTEVGWVAPMGKGPFGARCWGITDKGLNVARARAVTGQPITTRRLKEHTR